MFVPTANTRMNAWVRELCGIGGKYEEEGAMVMPEIIEKKVTDWIWGYNGQSRTR